MKPGEKGGRKVPTGAVALGGRARAAPTAQQEGRQPLSPSTLCSVPGSPHWLNRSASWGREAGWLDLGGQQRLASSAPVRHRDHLLAPRWGPPLWHTPGFAAKKDPGSGSGGTRAQWPNPHPPHGSLIVTGQPGQPPDVRSNASPGVAVKVSCA